MKTVYKYPLETIERQKIDIHRNAMFLSAGIDPSGGLCLWALVDTAEPMATRTIFIVGTGFPIADNIPMFFLDTVKNGPFMWHVFYMSDE